MVTKRKEFVDYAKGLAMITIIAGHASIGGAIGTICPAYHVPLFFLVSGFLSNDNHNQSIGRAIGLKAKKLLIPYFSFALVHIALFMMMEMRGNVYAETNPLYCLLVDNTYDMPIHGIQWFLTAMFFMCCLVEVLRLIPSERLRIILGIAIAAVAMCYSKYVGVLPLAFGQGCAGVGFYTVGLLLKKNWQKLSDLSVSSICVMALLAVGLILFNGKVNIRVGKYGIIPLFFINASLSTTIILLLMQKFEKCRHGGALSWIKKELSYIGANSIIYMCMNELSVILFTKVLRRFTLVARGVPDAVFNLTVLACSLCFLHFVALVFRRKPLCWMLGK